MKSRRVATRATRKTDGQSFMLSLMMCRGTRASLTVDDSMVSLSRVEHYINVSDQRYATRIHSHTGGRPPISSSCISLSLRDQCTNTLLVLSWSNSIDQSRWIPERSALSYFPSRVNNWRTYSLLGMLTTGLMFNLWHPCNIECFHFIHFCLPQREEVSKIFFYDIKVNSWRVCVFRFIYYFSDFAIDNE